MNDIPGITTSKSEIKLRKHFIFGEEKWAWWDGSKIVSPEFTSIQCALAYAGKVPFMDELEWKQRPIPEGMDAEILPTKLQTEK